MIKVFHSPDLVSWLQ